MPHAIEAQDEADELLIQKALSFDPQNELDFNRELEPGEKADDAIDFEDISDNDLAEDEDETNKTSFGMDKEESFGALSSLTQEEGLAGLTNESGLEGDAFDVDDLFGEGPSSPVEEDSGQTIINNEGGDVPFDFDDDELFSDSLGLGPPSSNLETLDSMANDQLFRVDDFSVKSVASPKEHLSKEALHQQELFEMSRRGLGLDTGDHIPAPPENQAELLASLWPRFEKNTVPRFMDLLPPKKAHYVGKTPLKPPKPVQPTKIRLEIAADQEKNFRLVSSNNKRTREDYEKQGLIMVPDEVLAATSDEVDLETISDSEGELPGGVTFQDLQHLCVDWDVPDVALSPTPEPETSIHTADQDDLFREIDEQWAALGGPPGKKRKLGEEASILATPRFEFHAFHDPERATAKIAKAIMLDLNDPQLLIDEETAAVERRNTTLRRGDTTISSRNGFSKSLNQRYNISNDEAYDLLKENHQSKVRSTLGNLTVSHSMPALRLQWPYYKTKLAKQEARSFHRPTAYLLPKGEPIMFSKPRVVKRKHLKGKEPHDVFQTTRDLSQADNSYNLLLEYSEENPVMLSNFGMGSRLINYYRRKNLEDISRPKLDIGETAVLLPQDKSPFSIFGHVDPGQMTPTLHNSMYRAPVFKQESKSTDFLLVRNSTGVDGANWYLRDIENVHVVGQQFPSVDVPGPHSRKVTTASKNRLKMITYRRIRRNEPHRLTINDVTRHFTDSTDMQNRQKMKEFMVFSKEHKEWEMRPGESIPTEDLVRTMVKPEDVCLLEAMQVGQQSLLDAGYSKDDENSDDDENKEGQSIEQQLAPWHTSRNFINAASGKAMLQLHGEGDPSGRGEAFSFLKTSMKGGFRAMGESVEDKLDAKKLKELGGHSYNVARQQKAYEESIRRIWEGQKQSLSSTIEHSDTEMDQDDLEDSEVGFGRGMTPRSEVHTPAPLRRRDDETTSQYSKFSADSQATKVLRIIRRVVDKYGNEEEVVDIVSNPQVIRQYVKHRQAKEDQEVDLLNKGPTGDEDRDARAKKQLQKELARLERNKERRIARDKQKGIFVEDTAGSPGSPSSPGAAVATKGTGTQRKCANCGQVGHIKTNKKCPYSIS